MPFLLKRHCHEKRVSKKPIRGCLLLKYEPRTCLKLFRSTVLKLQFFKSTFYRSKNALPRSPGPWLNLIPGAGLILFIETRCAQAQGSSSAAGPPAVCGWITISSAVGFLVKRLQWKSTLICCPGPTHYIRLQPTVKFFQSKTLKKLARTALKFNHGPGPWVKAFLLRTNVDLKNRSFKTVDQKIFKYSSGSYLRRKPSPNRIF
jgi:hypothetical protein